MNSSCPNLTDWKTVKDHLDYFVLSWHIFLLVVGLPGNVLVARISITLIGHRQKRVDSNTTHRGCSKMSQLFVLNLAIIDMLALVMNSCTRFGEAVDLGMPCWVIIAASHWSTIASSLAVLCLNVDRFLAIIRPLHYGVLMTKHRIYVSIISCWLAATGWPIFFIQRTYGAISGEECSLDRAYVGYYVSYTCIFFIIPNCIALCLSFFIALVVVKSRRRVLTECAKDSTRPGLEPRTSGSGSTKIHLRHSDPNKKQKTTTKMLTYVFVATIWQCVTNLPYRVHALLGIWLEDSMPYSTVTSNIMASIFLAFMYSNPAGNPYVTVLTQRRYRMVIRQGWVRKKWRLATSKAKQAMAIYAIPMDNMGVYRTSEASSAKY